MEYLQVNNSLLTNNVVTLMSVGKSLVSKGHRVFAPKTHKPLFIVVIDSEAKTKRTILFDTNTYSWGINAPKNKLGIPTDATPNELLEASLNNFSNSQAVSDEDISFYARSYKELKWN